MLGYSESSFGVALFYFAIKLLTPKSAVDILPQPKGGLVPTFDPDHAEGIANLQAYNEELWAENNALRSKIIILEEDNARLQEFIDVTYGGASDNNT